MKLNSISKFQAKCKREHCPLVTAAGLFVHACVDFPTFATQQRLAKRNSTPANSNFGLGTVSSDCTSKPHAQVISPDPGRVGGGQTPQTATNNYD